MIIPHASPNIPQYFIYLIRCVEPGISDLNWPWLILTPALFAQFTGLICLRKRKFTWMYYL